MPTNWRAAEHLAAEHMKALGFSDAAITKSGADGGVDVAGTDAVAQVKFHAKPVGSPDIQRLRGAAHGITHALFYAASGYSMAATAAATSTGIALFTYNADGSVDPANDVAREMVRSPATSLSSERSPGVFDHTTRQQVVQRLQTLFIRKTAFIYALQRMVDRLRPSQGDLFHIALQAQRSYVESTMRWSTHFWGEWSIPSEVLRALDRGKPGAADELLDEAEEWHQSWVAEWGERVPQDWAEWLDQMSLSAELVDLAVAEHLKRLQEMV